MSVRSAIPHVHLCNLGQVKNQGWWAPSYTIVYAHHIGKLVIFGHECSGYLTEICNAMIYCSVASQWKISPRLVGLMP